MKKPSKIHFLDSDGRYLCIKAHGAANLQKVTKNKREITCKNCRKILKLNRVMTTFVFR